MKYDLDKAMNGMFHASHKRNCYNMKVQKKGRRRSDYKTGKCKGWKGIPKKGDEGKEERKNSSEGTDLM
jgi:hypothetical protein